MKNGARGEARGAGCGVTSTGFSNEQMPNESTTVSYDPSAKGIALASTTARVTDDGPLDLEQHESVHSAAPPGATDSPARELLLLLYSATLRAATRSISSQ